MIPKGRHHNAEDLGPNGVPTEAPDDTPILTEALFVELLRETGDYGGGLGADLETYPVAQLASYTGLDVRLRSHAGLIVNGADQVEGFACYALLEDRGEPAWRRVFVNELTRTYWMQARRGALPPQHDPIGLRGLSRRGGRGVRREVCCAPVPERRGDRIRVRVCLASARTGAPVGEQEWTTFEVAAGVSAVRHETVRGTWANGAWTSNGDSR